MKLRKRSLALLLAAATVLSLAVGTFAYFTDHIVAETTATAGSLDLTLTTPVISKTEQFKPSEGISIQFTLSNAGNKSADVLETLVLTSSQAMTGSATKQCEFELYRSTDVTLNNGIATIKSGATPLTVKSISADNKKITYAIPEFVLNGTGENAETEPEANGKSSKTSSYVLVFRNDAGNQFQNVTITLDYEAQAKQHRNTDSSTWTTVKNQTISFAGNNAYKAVPVLTANP